MKVLSYLFTSSILFAGLFVFGQDNADAVSLVVLGTVQDAGSPQIDCKKECCEDLFEQPDPERKVSSLGLVDSKNNKKYLFDATPDIGEQLKHLNELSPKESDIPDGVFITHAHIGHYSGLMYLGMEAAHTRDVPVFAMPRMKKYLETNGPWSQLVVKNNINIKALDAQKAIILSEKLTVTPLLVPHRDEYSETVGFIIAGPNKKALFIPDIDKWSHWDVNINQLIGMVDYDFLDATFYSADEIPGRDLTKVLHPFVTDSMARFDELDAEEKGKVYFIHLNHTNPLLIPESEACKTVYSKGYHVARFGDIFKL